MVSWFCLILMNNTYKVQSLGFYMRFNSQGKDGSFTLIRIVTYESQTHTVKKTVIRCHTLAKTKPVSRPKKNLKTSLSASN